MGVKADVMGSPVSSAQNARAFARRWRLAVAFASSEQAAEPSKANGASLMTVREPDDRANQSLHAANEQRTLEATGRNRKLAATALLRLGGDCPPELEEVGTELILHSENSWSEIASRLGVTRSQAVHRFRRLLTTAGVAENGSVSAQ